MKEVAKGDDEWDDGTWELEGDLKLKKKRFMINNYEILQKFRVY